MFRKVLLSVACSFTLVSAASAQPSNLSVSTDFVSKYIWNAFDRIASRGLDDGPLVQPRVQFELANSPLVAHVGGSFIMNDHSELHETVYGLSVVKSASPLSEFSFGYNYYDDRVSAVRGVDVTDIDGHEVWAKLVVHNSVGSDPSLIVKYEQPTNDGADAYFVAIGGLAYDVPLLNALGSGPVDVEFQMQTNVVYNSGVTVNDQEVVRGGIAAWQVGFTGHIKTTSSLVVSPQVSYQITTKDSVNRDNPFWAGVKVSLGY